MFFVYVVIIPQQNDFENYQNVISVISISIYGISIARIYLINLRLALQSEVIKLLSSLATSTAYFICNKFIQKTP